LANFDETLKEYQEKREEVRGYQGEVQKLRNAAAEIDRDLGAMVKKYNIARKHLLDIQDRLIPSLKSEVASHPMMEREEETKIKQPIEKIASPRPGAPRPDPLPSEEQQAETVAPGAK